MTIAGMHEARTLLAVGLLAVLAACAGKPGARPAPAPPPVAATDQIAPIVQLLDDGDAKEARKRLRDVLKREPLNAEAQLLRDSIDRDPTELLGPKNYPYTVRPGETMLAIAERLLGNRLKFYQLARYNGIDRPTALAADQELRIPGEAPRPAPPPRAPEPARPAPSAPATDKPKPAPAPKPVKPAANPVAARQARAAGLAALNQGKVQGAVALLRRAAALDPGNPVIARELQRAERIAATVRARKP